MKMRNKKTKKASIAVESILKIIILILLFAALGVGVYNLLKLLKILG